MNRREAMALAGSILAVGPIAEGDFAASIRVKQEWTMYINDDIVPTRQLVSKKVQELFCRHLGVEQAEAIAMFVDGYCYRYEIPFGDGQIPSEAKRRMFAGESFTPAEFQVALGASNCKAVILPQFENLTGIPFSNFVPLEGSS